MTAKLKEADLMRAVKDYLTYGMNQGKWYFDRLNSGSIIALKGKKPYKVELCREGTADFVVLQKSIIFIKGWRHNPRRTVFLELKSLRGKQRPEQAVFQRLVEAQGAEYWIIRSIEDLREILEENNDRI